MFLRTLSVDSGTSLIDLRCGSCQKSSDQKVVAEYKHVIGQEEEFDGQPFYNEEEWLLRISLCQLCNTVNLSVEAIDGGEVTLLYPTPLPDLEGLPENIARAYKAARAVKPIDDPMNKRPDGLSRAHRQVGTLHPEHRPQRKIRLR